MHGDLLITTPIADLHSKLTLLVQYFEQNCCLAGC